MAAVETKHDDNSMDLRSDDDAKTPAGANNSSNGSNTLKIADGWPYVLNTNGYPHSLKISKDLLTVKYISKGNHAYDVGSVRSSRPVPRECPIYYYEITVHDPGVRGAITIGMAPEDFNLTRQTGTTSGSYGYRGEDGRKFDGTSRAGSTYGPLFTLGDIVGCGLNLYDNTIFFTKNGRNLGVAYTVTPQVMYPTISLHSPNEQISCNFGQSAFKFDIDGMRADEKEKMELNIACNRVEPSILIRMVRQYLLHSGYQDTLAALDSSYGKDNASSSASTPSSSSSSVPSGVSSLSLTPSTTSTCSTTGDGSADSSDSKRSGNTNTSGNNGSNGAAKEIIDERLISSLPKRKEIRAAIVNGDITVAMRHIDALTPSLLKTRPQLQFQLHCQHFIGLVKSNELDTAITFARQVLQTYDEPPNRAILQGVMGLLAYVHMESSPVAHLLTRAHRESVADQVNTAIVEQLGSASRSSLELMLRQLVVTHDTARQMFHGMTVPLTL